MIGLAKFHLPLKFYFFHSLPITLHAHHPQSWISLAIITGNFRFVQRTTLTIWTKRFHTLNPTRFYAGATLVWNEQLVMTKPLRACKEERNIRLLWLFIILGLRLLIEGIIYGFCVRIQITSPQTSTLVAAQENVPQFTNLHSSSIIVLFSLFVLFLVSSFLDQEEKLFAQLFVRRVLGLRKVLRRLFFMLRL